MRRTGGPAAGVTKRESHASTPAGARAAVLRYEPGAEEAGSARVPRQKRTVETGIGALIAVSSAGGGKGRRRLPCRRSRNLFSAKEASVPTAIPTPSARGDGFLAEVMAATPGDNRLDQCIQCGSCGGSCPSGAEMEHTPRRLFALIRAGARATVLRSNAPWYCVSCYYCTVRCPQQIHITDVMYTLKAMAIRAGLFHDTAPAGFSETFVDYVEKYGRSFELGLATRFNLRHHPLALAGMAPLGLGMLRRGRMDLTPHRIAGMAQLSAILERAKALEAAA
jgi:heterodisulfide reductase subunit C